MLKDVLRSSLTKKVIAPISGAGDDVAIVGAIIDHQGVESSVYELATGVLADANATFAVLLEEGDEATLTDAAAVADADMISQDPDVAPETAASFNYGDDGEVRRLGYRGTKRYTRLTITPTNNTGAWPISVICRHDNLRYAPQTQPAS